MDLNYDPQKIEAKWQKRWAEAKLFASEVDPGRKKYYVLEMLPYPSGDIHMGHVRNYSIGDALARYMWMKGFNVIHPIGWDAFGLPAENAAIQHQRHPSEFTFSYIDRMREQWFLKTRAYAEQLLEDMKQLVRWPERVLVMQQNWIGKSVGTEVDFRVAELEDPLRIFTTRVDTIFGCTALFLAPEHPVVERLIARSKSPEKLRAEVELVKASAVWAWVGVNLEKQGVDTGSRARNPYNGESVPVWVANFVLMEYGTV